MGLFNFFKRDEKAMPDPGSPEFDAMVKGSAIPDGQSVEMGNDGWASADKALEKLGIDPSKADVEVEQTTQTIDLRGTDAREKIKDVLRENGIDPDKEGQTINANDVPGLKEKILGALFSSGVDIPNAGGFGGGISPPKQDPLAMIEHLDKKRDAGEISDAEFEAAKKKLLADG